MEGNEGNQGKWVSQSPRRAVTADHSNFGAKQSRNTVAVDFGKNPRPETVTFHLSL